MHIESGKMYPNSPTIVRTVKVGGLTKSQLMQQLQQHAILMNESGKVLFENDNFTTSNKTYCLKTVELTVRDLGLPGGATMAQIFNNASQFGLELCPVELGPHLRLVYLDQPEGYSGKPFRQHQAPYGSITIASKILSDDENVPKGFYLRRIKGDLWLRGYRADHKHVWDPDDHFIFCEALKQ